MTGRELRAHGVATGVLEERCGPGGPWQRWLPEVYLLHPGPPSGRERVQAALLYATRPARGQRTAPEAMVTGPAALALLGFPGVPGLDGLERIDVLVGAGRRLADAGDVSVRRAPTLPRPLSVSGLACAPVPRAVADTVAGLEDAKAVRKLLVESVRTAGCEPGTVVRALKAAGLLSLPRVADSVDALLAEGRSLAESRMYAMVRDFGLPDPLWNVDLRLPGGPYLASVDAYWPDQAVALELEARPAGPDEPVLWTRAERGHQRLAGLGVAVVRTTARKLRTAPAQQAAALRTALIAADDRPPNAYLAVLPR